MALIPVTDKFHVVDTSIPTVNKGSAQANSGREAYTMQDVIDTVGSTGGSQPVATGLSAQGIDNTTTSIMSYGINIFTIADASNYATKLPQPITGQSAVIINNTLQEIYVYPSNVGGQINNLAIDAPYAVPPDGIAVTFVCTENPLPGEWNTVINAVPPAPIVYEFSMDTSASGSNGVAFGHEGIPGATQSSSNPAGGIFGDSTGSYGSDVVPSVSMSNTAPPGPIIWGSTLPGSYNTLAPDAGIVANCKIETNVVAADFVAGTVGTGFELKLRRYFQNNASGTPPYQITNQFQLFQVAAYSSTQTGFEFVDSASGTVAPAYAGNIGDEGTLFINSVVPIGGAAQMFSYGNNCIGAAVSFTATDFYYNLACTVSDSTVDLFPKKIYNFRMTLTFSA